MNGSEKGLQALSLIAIVMLSAVVIDLLSEPDQDPEIIYVLVDNRIIIDENYETEELNRSDVVRVASFNIKVFGDTKMRAKHFRPMVSQWRWMDPTFAPTIHFRTSNWSWQSRVF